MHSTSLAMKVLFLDQSGKPGGAELCLLDIAKQYRDRGLVVLFADGAFRELLENHQIPVQVIPTDLAVKKDSTLQQGLASLWHLLPLINQVAHLSRNYDLIYANTQKALVVGAIASLISRRPLVYHLHDIISADHFSVFNRRLIVMFANLRAALIIANSHASRTAFGQAGGQVERVKVVYNGFHLPTYEATREGDRLALRHSLQLDDRFVVGSFSRLSPWKGQHILLEALSTCPESIVALFVGDALFGEHDYVEQLHQQVRQLGLEQRVHFLGFRADIPQLMTACDLVAHTAIAPEPFGRVIVEAMLCRTPVIATEAGGAMELIQHQVTGWLSSPADANQLAMFITQCWRSPDQVKPITRQAHNYARNQFDVAVTNQQIDQLLQQVCHRFK